MSKKGNKIIKLAAFALIGYGAYKAFFAEDNASYATTDSRASGSESKPRGNHTYYVSGRGEVSAEEYAEIQQEIAKEIAKDRQQRLEKLQQELENTTDASERVKIQRAINQVLEQQHHR